MSPATLKVNLQNPSGLGSGCEWWWWSRGLHLKLLVSSKANRKEMQDQSYGPWPMHVYELLWCQTRHSNLIWLKCKPFCKFTYTESLKSQHLQIPWRKHNSLSVFAFWFQPYSWPYWACCIHNCHGIFLWVLLGHWQRRQSHIELLLARVMPWMTHSHRRTSLASDSTIGSVEYYWSLQKIIDSLCQILLQQPCPS